MFAIVIYFVVTSTNNECIENMGINNSDMQLGMVEGHRLLRGYLLYPFLDFQSNDVVEVDANVDMAQEFDESNNVIAFNTDGWVKRGVNFCDVIRADCDSYVRMLKTPAVIPKILHQIWIGPKPMPKLLAMSREIMSGVGWEYRLWGDKEIDDLRMVNSVQYNATKLYPAKADIARIEILERFGGVYLDADSEFIRPFDDLVLRGNFVSAYESEVMRPGLIANGFIASVPGHKIIREIRKALGNIPIEDIVGMRPRTVWKVTGPKLLTKVIMEQDNNSNMMILPSYYLYPTHHTKFRLGNELTKLAYTNQIWQSTQDNNAIF